MEHPKDYPIRHEADHRMPPLTPGFIVGFCIIVPLSLTGLGTIGGWILEAF